MDAQTQPKDSHSPACHITTHDSKSNKATIHSSNTLIPTPIGNQARFTYVHSANTPRPSFDEEKDIKFAEEISSSRAALRLVQPNGSLCRLVDIAPGNTPHMHRTQSLDYVVIISGVVDLIMEDGSIRRCEAGDLVVQRGTKHAWRNPGNEWARMMVVMIESEKVNVGDATLEEDLGVPKKLDAQTEGKPLLGTILSTLRNWLTDNWALPV